MSDTSATTMLGLTAQIVAAHVGSNDVAASGVPVLIQAVYKSLMTAGVPETKPVSSLTPAVPIKRSVFPDYIVCLEDGRKLKMLQRHLQASYGMSPNDYRAKWGLPANYPMVAPNYAATRSSLAWTIGLGRKPMPPTSFDSEQPDAEHPETSEPGVTVMPARRARGSRG